jgi:hypothetical protein
VTGEGQTGRLGNRTARSARCGTRAAWVVGARLLGKRSLGEQDVLTMRLAKLVVSTR